MKHGKNYEKRRRNRDKAKECNQLNVDIQKTYGRWMPVEYMRRSFFVWKGKFSGSQKEIEIAAILKGQNLRFFSEVSFDLKKRFDFYIPLLDLVIEYDGHQHFESVKEINNDIGKEQLLKRLGVKLIRYNKTHNLKEQILHDLIYHPVLNS